MHNLSGMKESCVAFVISYVAGRDGRAFIIRGYACSKFPGFEIDQGDFKKKNCTAVNSTDLLSLILIGNSLYLSGRNPLFS